jgi:hypothetical protein
MTEPTMATAEYVELPDLPQDHELVWEWALFKEARPQLLAEGHEGRFVLIQRKLIIGPWDTLEEALDLARTLFGGKRFLIQQLQRSGNITCALDLWRQIPPHPPQPPESPPPALPRKTRAIAGNRPGRTVHYTQLRDLPSGHVLEREWLTYMRELPRLLAEGQEGRFILIKEEEIVGIWDDFQEAIRAGHERFGVVSFLVHHIQEWEPLLRVRGY